jgi:putative RNA 2'-phosphotransferase
MLSARTVVSLSKYIENILTRTSNTDEYGYMLMEDLIEEVNDHPLWEHIQPLDIKEVVNGSAIRRLELVGNKIRLIRPVNNVTTPFKHRVIPPATLYYGTTVVGISRVKTFGLKPLKDNYVKLFPSKSMVQVMVHRNAHIAYVEIEAFKAHQDGIQFIKGDLNTYLANHIPAKYIKKIT